MKTATENARLSVEDMSASEEASFLKWLRKRRPEAETPTLDDAARWWRAKLKSGDVLPGIGWPATVMVDDLVEDYINALKRKITKRGNSTAMGRFVTLVGAVGKDKSSVVGVWVGRKRQYTLRGLDECRDGFEEEYGKQDWDDDAQAQAGGPEADSEAREVVSPDQPAGADRVD
jgi:hypothetical protein